MPEQDETNECTIISFTEDQELRERYEAQCINTDYFSWRSGQFDNPRVLVRDVVQAPVVK
jgi:hypothetical protein